MLEVSVDLQTVCVMEGLTEDAVYARIYEGEWHAWIGWCQRRLPACLVPVGGCILMAWGLPA